MSARTLPPLPRMSVPPPGGRMPECEAFSDEDFGRRGGTRYRTTERVAYAGDDLSGKIGSIIVHSGWWRFYLEKDFTGRHLDLGAGDHNLAPEWRNRFVSFEPVAF